VANTYHHPKISLHKKVVAKSAAVETKEATCARRKETKVRGRSGGEEVDFCRIVFFI